MSDEDWFSMWAWGGVTLIAFIVGLMIGSAVVHATVVKPMRKQAVERGHAEYNVSSDGEAAWRWKE